MTATIKPSVSPTAFDHAFDAAVAAGWPGEFAFIACCCMKAYGLTETEIERLFNDAARRIQ